ncbi:MAG: hypothetical protein AAB133_00725 [Pseudomonadota bacterium]
MIKIVLWLLSNWAITGTVYGVLWGVFAAKVYTPKEIKVSGVLKNVEKERWFLRAHQFIVNFVCSFLGVFCFHLLHKRYFLSPKDFDNAALVLFVIAVFGINGFLAGGIYKFTRGIEYWRPSEK